MKPILLIGLLTALAFEAFAQFAPLPAAPQPFPVVLRGVTVHDGKGRVIIGTDVLIEEGIITQIGPVTQVFKQSLDLDLKGRHVYPGLISMGSFLGLQEVEAVRATRDLNETGPFNPNARALVAYSTDSRITPTVRSNGVLSAQVAPQGGVFSGTSSVMRLDGWNWEEAALLPDDGVWLNWPDTRIYDTWWAPPVEEQKKNQREQREVIARSLDEARAYAKARAAGEPLAHNLQLEALGAVLRGEKQLYIRANNEQQMLEALDFAQKHKLRIVIAGGMDAALVADRLRAQNVPVILNKIHSLPLREDDPVDAVYRLPAQLEAAGIRYAYSYDPNWGERNLPFLGGSAAAWGLDKEAALKALTSYPAEILGLGDRLGSLEPGKEATLIISEGDLLDMKSSQVTHAFIQGRQIDLRNAHIELYERFSKRYAKGN